MNNDIIDISMDFENLDNSWGDNKKTNFGGGIELLMNDKKSEAQGLTSDIDIDDLNNLENELNDLVEDIPYQSSSSSSSLMSSDFEANQSIAG